MHQYLKKKTSKINITVSNNSMYLHKMSELELIKLSTQSFQSYFKQLKEIIHYLWTLIYRQNFLIRSITITLKKSKYRAITIWWLILSCIPNAKTKTLYFHMIEIYSLVFQSKKKVFLLNFFSKVYETTISNSLFEGFLSDILICH